jgi:hypothetical protein
VNIGYYSEPVKPYCAAIAAAKSPEELREKIRGFSLIAWDALKAANGIISGADWQEWRRGLRIERKGEFAGEEFARRYGAILMPEIMVRVTMLAEQYTAPWGTAYIRAREAGLIVEADGRASWKERQKE